LLNNISDAGPPSGHGSENRISSRALAYIMAGPCCIIMSIVSERYVVIEGVNPECERTLYDMRGFRDARDTLKALRIDPRPNQK